MTVSTAETAKKPGRTASDACYSLGEEIANAVTHGVAALLSIAGLCVLVAFAANYSGSAKVVTAVSIFGASMVLLYTASTLYHAIPNINAKRVLQILDHAMIYVLIAGSYTPFCLITLKGWVGIALCIAVWAQAALPTAWASFSTSGKNSPTGMRSGTSSCFWARPCSFSPFCCTSFRGYSIQERRNR